MEHPFQVLSRKITDTLTESFRDLVGHVQIAVVPSEILICSSGKATAQYEAFEKRILADNPGCPIKFLKGFSNRITDMNAMSVAMEALDAVGESHSFKMDSNPIGDLLIFASGPEQYERDAIKKEFELLGGDGQFRRLIFLWDEGREVADIVELNSVKPEAVKPKMKVLRGTVQELKDPDRERDIPITKENLIDLQIVLRAANNFDEVLAALDKVGNTNGY